MENEQKQYLTEIATLYLNGMSLRKIAELKGVSFVTIRNDLVNRLPIANRMLGYAVKEAMEGNKPKSVEDEDVQKRVMLAYKLLVEEDKTVEEIAHLLNESEFTIYRDLTRRLNLLYKNSTKVSLDMLENVANTLARHSLENSPFLSIEKRGR